MFINVFLTHVTYSTTRLPMIKNSKFQGSPFFQTLYFILMVTASSLFAQNRVDDIPSTTVEATIDITKVSPKIDDLLYGHFIENLFNWFEGGLLAEMLGDRKFFYPVTNSNTLIPQNKRAGILGRWRPVGSESFVMKWVKVSR